MNKKRLGKLILIAIIFNVVLTLIKLIFGYMGHAQALITDGYNSLSDVLMSFMVFFVLKISDKDPDEDHPYGHQKYEGIAYFALGMIFLLSAILLFVSNIEQMFVFIRTPEEIEAPTIITIYAAIIALVIKLFLAAFYQNLYKKSKHPTLKVESKNHSIDMISTGFTLIGVALAYFRWIIFDYIAALIIVFLILRLAINTLKEAITFLVDQAPEQHEIDEVQEFIKSCTGVISVDDLKIRKHMTKYYIDVEIGVNAQLSLKEAHKIAEYVHAQVEKRYPNVIHCMVHVNPSEHLSKEN